MLKRTPLYDYHVASGARMVDFAGWEMPIVYRSIVDEHVHTRTKAALFDVSHMGRVFFTGTDAGKFLDKVLTRNISKQTAGQSRYSLVCNESGGVLDDVIVSKDEARWIMVCNASNREKLLKHFEAVRQAGGFDVVIDDRTESTAMVALQGPRAIEKLSSAISEDIAGMKRYSFQTFSVMLVDVLVFRSGYTGEDGAEVVLPSKLAGLAMKFFGGRADSPEATIRPAGLGARDTLRLEAGMPLYGHELTEGIDPISAGLSWAVDITKDFIGAEPLRVIAQRGPARKLVGLELDGKRIARQGTPIRSGAMIVGEVASGTLGPTVGKSIATAFVDAGYAAEGTTLVADLKGTLNPAKVVPLPFYKRPA